MQTEHEKFVWELGTSEMAFEQGFNSGVFDIIVPMPVMLSNRLRDSYLDGLMSGHGIDGLEWQDC